MSAEDETDPAPTRTGARTRGADVVELAPRRIGRFQVLERAGKGAMGVVYAAYDAELDRKVAIKVLLAHATLASDFAERLRREARAMARVIHPNVVAVHDVGEHDGRPFIAMDFVQGADLRRHLAERRPSWRKIVELFVQAGRGLAAAHAVGVVHRDFKPDNVLVSDGGGRFTVRVADFGLASAAPTGASVDTAATGAARDDTPRTVSGAGTPAYMAPERWAELPASASTDQFGFCVALFEALAGHRPFAGDTMAALAAAITTGKRQPIPERTDVPRWVWRVVERGLALDPNDRYPSVEALLVALEADPQRRRRRIALGVAVAAVLASIAGARAYAIAGARAQCVDLGEASALAIWGDERRDVVQRAFARVGTAQADEAWAKVDEELVGYAATLADARAELCELHDVDHGIPDDAFALRDACLELRRLEGEVFATELEGVDAPTIAFAAEAARVLPAISDCDDARALVERPALPDDPTQRAAISDLTRRVMTVRARQHVGRQASALPLAEAAVHDAETVGHDSTLAEALLGLGTVQWATGDPSAAEASLSRAIEVAARGHDAEVEAEAWVQLAWVGGKRDASRVEDLVRGATAAIDRLTAAAPLRARLETVRGSLFAEAGDYARAIECHERSLALWTSIPTDVDVEVARVHNNLGWTYHMMGRTADARAHYESALATKEAVLGHGNPQLATTLHNLGMLAREQHEYATARAYLERALALTIAAVGEDHPRVANVLSELATTLLELGEPTAAVAAVTRALAILEHAPNEALESELRATLSRAR